MVELPTVLCINKNPGKVTEKIVMVVRIKLDRKVKSRLELILLFGRNQLMIANFIVSSSGVVSREHDNFDQSNMHDAFMARWYQILNKCSTYK